jgi:hypothetical protein
MRGLSQRAEPVGGARIAGPGGQGGAEGGEGTGQSGGGRWGAEGRHDAIAMPRHCATVFDPDQ